MYVTTNEREAKYIMEIRFNVTGERRKQLVKALAKGTGETAKYLGMPSLGFTVGPYTVDKTGTLTCDDAEDPAQIQHMLEALAEHGFESAMSDRFTIEVARIELSDAAIEILKRLVDSKASLIKKALAADRTEIEILDDRIRFPWFSRLPSPDEIRAFTLFFTFLLNTARSLQRAFSKERPVENEKYTFRCFLMRLGFIGSAYKSERKILLSRLEGNASYANLQPSEQEGEVGDL